MLELGDYSKKFHKNIIKPIIKLMPKLVITVGKKIVKLLMNYYQRQLKIFTIKHIRKYMKD